MRLKTVFFLAVFLLISAFQFGTAGAQEGAPADEVESSALVTLDGAPLFRVRGTTTIPAERRAEAIRQRIVGLARDPSFRVESLSVVEQEHYTDIMARGTRLLAIVDADARLEGLSRQEAALAALGRIKEAIGQYRRDHSPENLSRGTVRALLATAVAGVSLFLALWILGKIVGAAERRYRTSVKGLKVGSFDLIHAGRLWHLIQTLLRLVRVATVLAILYAYLQYVLSQFPGTRAMAGRLASLVLDPLATMQQSFVDYLPSLAFLVVLAVVTRYLLKMVRYFFLRLEYGRVTIEGFEPEWARSTYKLVRALIIVFAVVVAYPYVPGSGSEAFKGVSIFVGLIVSLGSSSAISNVIAGYTMVYRRTFKVGDRIKVGNVMGDVTEMRLLATHVRTIKNEIVIVPNSQILSESVFNYSRLAKTEGLILHTTVGIGYETPWRQVEAMLLQAADRTPELKKDPPPFVLLMGLDDFAVKYQINAYCDDPKKVINVYRELHRNILDLFNEHGVQIMTPAYEGDPETAKVVPKDQWYAPPAKPEEKKA